MNPRSDGLRARELAQLDARSAAFTSVTSPSDDSMEHLSAEERACLMYLEATIEALEVQEDSGLSNDEPDSVLGAEKMDWMRVNDISSLKSDESGRDQISDRAEQHAQEQTSEPQSNAKDLDTSVNLMTLLKPPVTEPDAGCEIQPSATKADELCVSKDENGKIRIVSSTSQPAPAPEIDLSLIPPPSDFMDEPGNPPQPEKANDPPPSAETSTNKPGATVDLEELHQRASTKTISVSSPVVQEPPNKPPDLSPSAVSSGPMVSPPPDTMEPRSPPAVAPKPKKLPANIVLKSHKAAVADGNSGHSVPTSGDRLLLDPQRVHMEALRKLGLLKSDDHDTGPVLSPKLSPQTRRSWAVPSSPSSPAAPHTPPMTPPHTRLNSPSPASVPLQAPKAVSLSSPVVQLPDIVPAPPAFSDPDGPLLSDNEPVTTPPRTPPVLVKRPTPPRFKDVKSATLERSGLGLSSYMDAQDPTEAGQGVSGSQNLSQLRNSRPRPASLGSGKEFSSAQGESSQLGHAANKEPDLRRSLPAFQHSGDSQKLPRSQGISVLICPRSEKGDERREALRRLGLLRD
ncbi:specifically androgen-regulated gene protein isoform 2-T4 [Acanthopagrus schlegelii]